MVYGVPENTTQMELEQFATTLVTTIVGVEELRLTPKLVSVFFPPDRLKAGLGGEIIVFVEGLFYALDRTHSVKEQLACLIVDKTCKLFPCATMVECFVRTFCQEEEGCWGHHPPRLA